MHRGGALKRKMLCFVTATPMTVRAFLNSHLEYLSERYEIYVITNCSGLAQPETSYVTYINVAIAREISLLGDLRALFALLALFRSHRFDAIHSVTPKAGLLAMLAGWLTRTPVRVHWYTGQVWVNCTGVRRVLLKGADWLIGALASNLLVDSPSQKDFLVAEGVCSTKRAEVIGDGSICGVDGDRFKPNPLARDQIRLKHGIPKDAPLILFLGRLNKDKGLCDIAEAMLSLNACFDELHWLVVGPDEGGMAAHVSAKVGAFADRVHIQGITHEPETYMAAADIFCLPSYREGFGNSVLEAAAVGIPTVATRIYGLTDAVEDGVTGLLVNPGDSEDLAKNLRLLLEDVSLRHEMGEAARKRALELFSQERIVKGLGQFYARVFSSVVRGEREACL